MKDCRIAFATFCLLPHLAAAQPPLTAPLPGGDANPFTEPFRPGAAGAVRVPAAEPVKPVVAPAPFPDGLVVAYVVGPDALLKQVKAGSHAGQVPAPAAQGVAGPQGVAAQQMPEKLWAVSDGRRVHIEGQAYVAEVSGSRVRLHQDVASSKPAPKRGNLVWLGEVLMPVLPPPNLMASGTATVTSVGVSPQVVSGRPSGGSSGTNIGSGSTGGAK